MPSEPHLSRTESQAIVGTTGGLRNVWHTLRLAAPVDATVLIYGETGTGKELIARAIHDQSRRRCAPFVAVNCAAIPAGLLESELFGHCRGAFTGACRQTTGRFECAHRGTLFLDEIGDMPLDLQPKILRVLQEQEFERLGSVQKIHVDVRIVAATNQDLERLICERRFRADLFYRLNVIPVSLPPLRERFEDLPDLVRQFVSITAARMSKQIDTIPDTVMDALRSHDWPGNIRELHNVLERAVIMSPGPILTLPPFCAFLPMEYRLSRSTGRTLKDVERDRILEAVKEANGVIGGPNGAAVQLGLPRTTLLCRMSKLGIKHVRPE